MAVRVCACAWGVLGLSMSVFAADPWADRVVGFDAGVDAAPGYDVPGSALGSPSRITGAGEFAGPVSPFNPAYNADQVYSIGAGGFLTLAFDEAVVDDPANPFGIDLLVFGNQGFIDASFSTGGAPGMTTPTGAMFGSNVSATIEVSVDGLAWTLVTGLSSEGLFPTLGYVDLAGPYESVAGAIESDFTRPVDPAFIPAGRTFAEIVAGYNGSGGGVGIDLASTRLSAISYVRIALPAGATGNVEIDALADVSAVPGPGVVGFATLLGFGTMRRRRGTSGAGRSSGVLCVGGAR